MKRFLLIIFASALLIESFASAQDLKYSIQTDKPTYKLKEPIYVKLFLKNISKQNVSVNRRFLYNFSYASEHEVLFDITGPNGEALLFIPTVFAGRPTIDNEKDLEPNDFVQVKYKLSELFSFDRKGKYKIRSTYENAYALIPGKTWTGSLESDPVMIEVQ